MLPDDEEEVPLKERRRWDKGQSGKVPEVQVPQSTLMPGTALKRSTDLTRTNVTFAIPLLTDYPSRSATQTPATPIQLHASELAATSIALPSSLFTAYQTPDDPLSAAKGALLQLNLVMG